MLSQTSPFAPPRMLLGRLLLLGLVAACADSGASADADPVDEGTVVLVGERAGLMIWQSFAGATSYQVELFTPGDSVEHTLVTADTVSGYPAGFASAPGKSWQVRAFGGERQIARSIKAPVY